MGKHTTLLLRWKMNVPNRSRKQILKRKEDQPNSFTYVKEKESQDSYLRVLIPAGPARLNAENEIQLVDKLLPF